MASSSADDSEAKKNPSFNDSSSCSTHSREPAKYLPVVFVLINIVIIYFIYMALHVLPLLRDETSRSWAKPQAITFNVFAALLVLCYARCFFQNPGTIPDDPNWQFSRSDDAKAATGANDPRVRSQELKRSGDRRHCKWCDKYKPDRCHHCRVCRTCILKMDHHRPCIYNCVVFRNHKYFFLLIFYTMLTTHFVIWTMGSSVKKALDPSTAFARMFLLLFGETLTAFLAGLSTLFFIFHMWLVEKSMTTIEFCEKSMKKSGYNASTYSKGPYQNVQAVLGDNPVFWLFPGFPPRGNGLYFLSEETPLARDMETGGLRVRAHRQETATNPGELDRKENTADVGTDNGLAGRK